MPKTTSGKKVVSILCRKFGFSFVSQKGSHVKLAKKISGHEIITVVPQHKELAHGTLKGALELAHIDEKEFWEKATRHSQAISKNHIVAATITISNNPGEKNIGLQIEGIAEKVEGDMLEVARQHRKKRGKPEPEKEGETLDEGKSWYQLKPTKIELIYEPLFGFEKKIIKL